VFVPVAGFFFSESLEVARSLLGWFGVAVFIVFAAALYMTFRKMSRRLAAEALRRRAAGRVD
jgi:protein-S-isoprenylcysteine O-methyltransferase Ste14